MTAPIEIRFDLHPAQMAVFNDKTRFRVLAAGRRFGKTTLAISEACCAALSPKNKLQQPVFLIAPTQPQAKLLYWRPLIEKLNKLIVSTNVNEGLIYLNNGVLVGVKGADSPESLRGPGLFFAALDEYGSMKFHLWTDIIRPMLVDSRGRALFIGTPPYERNQFYDLYMEGVAEVDPEIRSFTYESKDNPFLPEGEIESARKRMSTTAFNREFRAKFVSATSGHIKEEWIKYQEKEPKGGAFLVAIDLAGFDDLRRPMTARQRRLDEHVIVTVKVLPGEKDAEHWWVKDIQKGRWGTKECAKRIVDVLLKVEPMAWGMERGALYRAVLPYIQDEATRRQKDLMTPIPLSHENKVKESRILWAIQGRLEHGHITFARGDWNDEMEDQLVQFPSTMVHDDIPDALSYIAQLSQGRTFEDFSEIADEPYWKPQDASVGF